MVWTVQRKDPMN